MGGGNHRGEPLLYWRMRPLSHCPGPPLMREESEGEGEGFRLTTRRNSLFSLGKWRTINKQVLQGSSSKRFDSLLLPTAASRRATAVVGRYAGIQALPGTQAHGHTGKPISVVERPVSDAPVYKNRQILGRERNTTSYRKTQSIARTFIRVQNHRPRQQPIICMCTRRLVRHGVEVPTSMFFLFFLFPHPPLISHGSRTQQAFNVIPCILDASSVLAPHLLESPHQKLQDVMRALHWDACGAKAFCVPLPESGARGWGRRQLWMDPALGDGSGSSCAENATPHTPHLQSNAHPPGPGRLRGRDPNIPSPGVVVPLRSEDPKGQPDRNEYWLLGMRHSCTTGSRNSQVDCRSWKLPSSSGDLPSTAKSGGVCANRPGLQGAAPSDWDVPVRDHRAHPSAFIAQHTTGSSPAKCHGTADAPPDQGDLAGGRRHFSNLSLCLSRALNEDGLAPCTTLSTYPYTLA